LLINISFSPTFDVTSAGREAIRPLSAEFGHVTQATPINGSFYGPDAVGVRHLCLYQIWGRYLYSFRCYKGVPKFLNLVMWPRTRPLWGSFVVRPQQGSVIYDCAKFEADISIRSKVIRGSQNFESWPRDLGHAHFGVILWSGRSKGPSSMYLPNLKQIVPKL